MKLHFNDRITLAAMALVFVGALAYAAANACVPTALAVGLPLSALALGLAAASQGRTGSAIGLPVLGMAMVALLIHCAHGHAEAHFGVFSFLACVAVYRRWESVVAAAATIAVHHLTFNFIQTWGWGPVCFTQPSLGAVFEHAAYVVGEAAVLIGLVVRTGRDARTAEELRHIADDIVADDGSISFRSAHAPHESAVAGKLQHALRHIERTLAEVREAADSIRNVAGEIAGGSEDLSVRTEKSASSLQATASSMEQLTRSLQHGADSARRSEELAASAADVAGKGGAIVDEVVTTMNRINASSKEIAEIIGVIDAIAFQTNILALNAAVEAARAGEQGRGFSVVAGEVRSLAQRSARSAQEIKTLISNSVEAIESGARLVGNAGTTMSEIVDSVRRVSDTLGDIRQAAVQQTSGIGQINGAVAGLDATTQQNAALVEESSAAAYAMNEQAERLAGLVSQFKLEDARARAHA